MYACFYISEKKSKFKRTRVFKFQYITTLPLQKHTHTFFIFPIMKIAYTIQIQKQNH